ncbi:AraC family transcriptional regulator [Paenibacillus arenilitoris]|uniref:AraC family transcriptional regulator n=1 Tax=Paenibacillus arenilitoris TaxID=2772299 RepID=A0A927CJI0_9BACL|nr:AraC family transcriptional regulator [Paenibacillus arenilitoris]MBD2869234.1 AraC family transcriptional regulator [Paenibacillus arenilitoris]
MNRPVETYRGEHFFGQNLLLFVNRNNEDFLNPYHNHDFIECTYIAEGTGFHHIGDSVHKVRKGHVLFIPIGQPHVFRPVSPNIARNPLSVYNCVFSPQLLRKLGAFATDYGLLRFLREMEDGQLPPFAFTDANDEYEKLFLALHREFMLRQSGSADYMHALLLQLLVLLQRSMGQTGAQPPPKQTAFGELLHYLDRHCGQELTLAQLAEASRWSERHLQRLFRRHTGQSFLRCLQNIRIRKSQELLRGSQLKIGAIAETVGYKDIHSFNSLFKRCTGMTPGAYRKEASAGAALRDKEEPDLSCLR